MLSKRLEAIASLITTDSIIDVGCDHGYLDIYLTKKGIKHQARNYIRRESFFIMGISKTAFMRGMQCPKMLWLDKHKPEFFRKLF